MNTPHAIPPDMHSITPHLVCRGAADATAIYARAFGAVELTPVASVQRGERKKTAASTTRLWPLTTFC